MRRRLTGSRISFQWTGFRLLILALALALAHALSPTNSEE
jgi:hypothetical protein